MYGMSGSSVDEENSAAPIENESHIDVSMLPDPHPAGHDFPVDVSVGAAAAGLATIANESHSSSPTTSPKALHQIDVDVDMVMQTEDVAPQTQPPQVTLDTILESDLSGPPAAKRRKIELETNPDE